MTTQSAEHYISGLNAFYQKVFGYMFLGVGITAILSFFIAQSPQLVAFASNPIVFILTFVVMIGILWKASPDISPASAWTRFIAFSAISALFITPYVLMHTAANITLAFISACITFAVAALYGYTTKKDLSGMANLFIIGFIAAFVVILINLFIGSTWLSLGISLFVIPLYLGMIAWETQALRDMYDQKVGDSEKSLAIFGALHLYVSFKGLFIHLLNLLGILND
jgi:FtsH-binding integral membrane protein